MRDIKEFPDCPIATFTLLMGNKWKLMIIRDLLVRETFFGELKRDLGNISHKVLTENLRALEADGLVKRTVYPEKPIRVSYQMPPFGQSPGPIYEALAQWSIDYKHHFYPESQKEQV